MNWEGFFILIVVVVGWYGMVVVIFGGFIATWKRKRGPPKGPLERLNSYISFLNGEEILEKSFAMQSVRACGLLFCRLVVPGTV